MSAPAGVRALRSAECKEAHSVVLLHKLVVGHPRSVASLVILSVTGRCVLGGRSPERSGGEPGEERQAQQGVKRDGALPEAHRESALRAEALGVRRLPLFVLGHQRRLLLPGSRG